MALTWVVVAVLAAAGDQKPVSLALPGLNGVNLAAGEAQLQSERVAQKLARYGVKVSSARDLETVIGLEREKALLGGCRDNTQCMTEIAAALGVDGVLVGDLGRLDDGFTLNLKVLSSTGATLAFTTEHGPAATLDAMMDHAVRTLLRALATTLQHPELDVPEPAAAAPHASRKLWALVPGLVGLAGVGTGIGLQFMAGASYAQLRNGTHYSVADASNLRSTGQGIEAGANAALIAGGVLIVAAVVLALTLPDELQPTVAFGPSGASIGLTGVFP